MNKVEIQRGHKEASKCTFDCDVLLKAWKSCNVQCTLSLRTDKKC